MLPEESQIHFSGVLNNTNFLLLSKQLFEELSVIA